MTLLVSDGASVPVPATFALTVYNNNVYQYRSVRAAQSVLVLPINRQVSITLPPDTFRDSDILHRLSFWATDCADPAGPIPAWLHFDAALLLLQGQMPQSELSLERYGAREIDTSKPMSVSATTRIIEAAFCVSVHVSDAFSAQQVQLHFEIVNKFPYLYAPILAQPTISLHLLAELDFSYDAHTFNEEDAEQVLSYTAYEAKSGALPSWMHFNPTLRRFSGSPKKEAALLEQCQADQTVVSQRAVDYKGHAVFETRCRVVMIVVASDGSLNCSTQFEIEVYNTPPFQKQPIYVNQFNATDAESYYLHVKDKMMFPIPMEAFTDLDAQDTIAVRVQGSPSWLNYQEDLRLLSGSPARFDLIAGECSEVKVIPNYQVVAGTQISQRQCINTITIVLADYLVTTAYEHKVIVYNTVPYPAQAVHDPIEIHPSHKLVYYIPPDVFRDLDELPGLQLSVRLVNLGHSGQELVNGLPRWLAFKHQIQLLRGTPSASDLDCNGHDSIRQVSETNSRNEPVTTSYRFCELLIEITASDGDDDTAATPQLLKIHIYNKFPWQLGSIGDARTAAISSNVTVHVDSELIFHVPLDLFEDADTQDALEYRLELVQHPNFLPDWLSFNPETNFLFGKAARENLLENCAHFEEIQCESKVTTSQGVEACVTMQVCLYAMRLWISDGLNSLAVPFNVSV